MTPKQFKAALAQLELSQVGAARLLCVDARTSRRWISGERSISKQVEILLRLLMDRKIKPSDIERYS